MSNDNIGNRIKNVRKILALQQTEFAKEIGISQSTISSYEKNLRNPPVSVLKTIADTYNINLDYLLNDKEPILLSEKVESLKLQSDKAIFFDEFCKIYNLDECSKKNIQEYLLLSKKDRHTVNKFIKIIKNIK
ncbi:MAG: helix-turn-helix transcriptional regulator [Escherichia coli]|jgi:transcriptional regulator with XRE-family HTH domain|nr:helix-turn-helix transcriptional regulator [Escherichia coli]